MTAAYNCNENHHEKNISLSGPYIQLIIKRQTYTTSIDKRADMLYKTEILTGRLGVAYRHKNRQKSASNS